MSFISPAFDTWTLTVLGLGWSGFLAIFIAQRLRSEHRKGPRVATVRRAPVALWGIALQGAGFALVWAVRRPEAGADAEVGAAALRLALVALLVAGSCALVLSAVRRLGKQWALAAQVVEGHELIRSGPYRIVRHPIYLGMGGFLLATGIALATFWALALAVALYLAGTRLRVAAEEKLLAQTFGADFASFRATVPAFLPGRSPAIPTPSLALGGFASATFALMHAALAAAGQWGEGLFEFLGAWPAEPSPLLLAAASTGGTVVTAVLFAYFAVHGFAGSGLLDWRPPLLRLGLVAISALYLLRGLAFLIQFYSFYKTLNGFPFVWPCSLSLAFATVGLIHLTGTISAWKRLRRAGPG